MEKKPATRYRKILRIATDPWLWGAVIFFILLFVPRRTVITDENPKLRIVGIERGVPGFILYNNEYNGYFYDIFVSRAKENNRRLVIKEYSDIDKLKHDLKQRRIDYAVIYEDNAARVKNKRLKSNIGYSEGYSISTKLDMPENLPLDAIIDSMAGRNIYISHGVQYTNVLDSIKQRHNGEISFVPNDLSIKDFSIDKDILIDIERFNKGSIRSIYRLKDSVRSLVLASTPFKKIKLEEWYGNFLASDAGKAVIKRNQSKNIFNRYTKVGYMTPVTVRSGSRYDDIFKTVGKEEKIDWRLLSAIAFIESKYHNDAVSNRSAMGLMQIIPRIGRSFGYQKEELLNPYVNVKVAAKLFKAIAIQLNVNRSNISDNDKISLILAAYNGGYGHIEDARRLAKEFGDDPDKWEDVSFYILKLNDPEYYKNDVVRFGRFNGKETLVFVDNVMFAYEKLK